MLTAWMSHKFKVLHHFFFLWRICQEFSISLSVQKTNSRRVFVSNFLWLVFFKTKDEKNIIIKIEKGHLDSWGHLLCSASVFVTKTCNLQFLLTAWLQATLTFWRSTSDVKRFTCWKEKQKTDLSIQLFHCYYWQRDKNWTVLDVNAKRRSCSLLANQTCR